MGGGGTKIPQETKKEKKKKRQQKLSLDDFRIKVGVLMRMGWGVVDKKLEEVFGGQSGCSVSASQELKPPSLHPGPPPVIPLGKGWEI